MPAKHPRIMTVVDEEMAEWLRKRSQAEGRSVSLVVREILAKQYAEDDERFWAKEGEETADSIDILYGCLKDLSGDPVAELESGHRAELAAVEPWQRRDR